MLQYDKYLILFFLTVLFFCACAPSGRTEAPGADGRLISVSEGTVTFSDDRGTVLSLPENPTKTAVLFSSFAELWCDAGGQVSVTVGESIARGLAEEGTPTVDSGAGKQINTEVLVSHMPTLVIGTTDIPAQLEASALLRAAGIPCAMFRVEDFADYLRVFEIFCALCGNTERFQSVALTQKTEIDTLLAAVPKDTAAPRILFLRAGTSARATKAKRAQDHFTAEMLAELGCENIAEEATLLLDGISVEHIVAAQPDRIFVSLMGDEAAARTYFEALLTEPAWQALDAVQNGSVCLLPKELFGFKPNGRWAEAYRYLYEILYMEGT